MEKTKELKEKLGKLSDEDPDKVAGGDIGLPDDISAGVDDVLPGREEIEGLLLQGNRCYNKSNLNC